MSDRITKTQRLLDLIAYLAGLRFPVSIDQVMEAVPAYSERWRDGTDTDRKSVRRTFERDKDDLRQLGIPIESVTYSMNYGAEEVKGYRLIAKDFYLPYLKLVGEAAPTPTSAHSTVEVSHEHAQEALDALRLAEQLPAFPLKTEARSAFRKLSFDLDPAAFREAPVLFSEAPGEAELRTVLDVLTDAILARKRVKFRYAGITRDAATDRDVAPYSLMFQLGHWYLVGDDALRDAVRVLRVTRMSRLEPNGERPKEPDFTVPDDFSMDDHVDRKAWELGDEEDSVEVRVRFEFPTSLWAAANHYGELEQEGEDGSARRTFQVQSVPPFLRWVLSMEGRATIEAPYALQDQVMTLAQTVAHRHRGEPSDG